MARIEIDNITKIDKSIREHDVVRATYSVASTGENNRVFQIDTYSGPDQGLITQTLQFNEDNLGKLMKLISSEFKSFSIPLLDDKGEVKYGINWGNRANRNVNQAYLDLPIDIYNGDFFPTNGNRFVIRTDDNQDLIFTRAQKDNINGHALQTPDDNSIIGLYLRRRLSVKPGEIITKEAIEAYGRNYITISKIGEFYYLDFSTSNAKKIVTKEKPVNTLQQIFYGAPGTGKSHGIKKQEDQFAEVIRTTFHPDSDYSTFVGAYKPTMKRTKKCVIIDKEEREITPAVTNDEYEERISYTFVKQAFLKAYIAAWESLKEEKNILLVIEEINRGNCAQIFGDLFQLLDREESGYSSYPICADEDLHQVLEREFALIEDMPAKVKSGEELLLPPNLYIWATMNTSDQSLFPIDSAFKRRWDWKYVPISKKSANYQIEVKKEDGLYHYDWWDFLDRVNTAISKATSSEDKKLGYFFCRADEKGVISADKFVSKVIFYLWNDVFKDFEIGDAKFRYNEDDLSLLSTKLDEDEVKREFSSFFDEDGNAKHEAVAKLLDDLKVKCELVIEGKEVEDGGSDESATAGGFLKVIFPGEDPITGSCTDVYFKTIQRLDVSEVRKLNLINEANGYLLIGTNEELPPNKLASRKDEATGLKVQTLKGHEARVSMLEKIRELLEADFEIITSSNDTPSKHVSDTNMPYRVTFPDGEVISNGNGWDTYVATLRKIGLDKALPYGDIFSRKNKTMPLITTKKIPDDGIYKYNDVDGYYVLSGTDSQHRLLRRLSKELNLGLIIE